MKKSTSKKAPIKHLTINKEKLEESYNNDLLEDSKRYAKEAIDISEGKLMEIYKMVSRISQHELDAADVLYDVIKHIHGTYDDKYHSEVTDWLDTKSLLLSEKGKVANIHSASKYIQRYSTTGFEKSEKEIDLYKSIHYLMIEIQRSRIHNKK